MSDENEREENGGGDPNKLTLQFFGAPGEGHTYLADDTLAAEIVPVPVPETEAEYAGVADPAPGTGNDYMSTLPLERQEWWQKHLVEQEGLRVRYGPIMDQIRTCIDVAFDEGHSRITFNDAVHDDVYVEGKHLIIRFTDGTYIKLHAEEGDRYSTDYQKRLDQVSTDKGHKMTDWNWHYEVDRWVSICTQCGATNTQARKAVNADDQVLPVWTQMAARLGCGDWS